LQDNVPGRGIFPATGRSCTVAFVTNSIRRLVLSLALGCPLLGVAATSYPREADREPREVREPREDRDRGGDRDRGADRADSSGRRERESDDRNGRAEREDRSGRNGGEERSGRDDRDDDRNDNSGNGSRRTPIDVERNERGGDRGRAEVLLIGPGNVADAARGAGYSVLSEQRLGTLEQSLVRVRVRDNESIEQAINTLRQRVPEVRAAPNHVFRPMASAPAGAAPMGKIAEEPPAGTVPSDLTAARIGIIDTGADATLAPLRNVVQAARAFASGGYSPRPHGSAVAQLAGAQGAGVAVCDVFGVDAKQRLVAPADAIAAAIDWLLSGNLRVINISIEGPRNEVLEFVIDAALARGTAIVAAVGNGGPAAPPGYPAAYPGVIAVTALDEKGLIYRRAGRGKQVQFAARGSFPGTGAPVISAEPVSGTSFAAPLVAAEIEHRWRLSPQATREQIVAAMRTEAVDLGDPGWDPVYGWGRVDLQDNRR
jgi:minor extracellular protease Epr